MGTFDPSTLDGGRLAPHQEKGLEFLLRTPRAVLADDVGLGKTVQAAAYLGALRDQGRLGRVLWVTEGHLIGQTRRELARFTPALSVAGSDEPWAASKPTKKAQAEYLKRFPHGPDITIVSYEFMSRRRSGLAQQRFTTVIFDEASALKGRGAEHEAAVDVARHAANRVAMTATPVELDVIETYSLLRVLDVPSLPSEDEWGNRYVRWRPTRSGSIPDGVREDALPDLRAFLATCLLRRTAEDVGFDLPRLVKMIQFVNLTPEQSTAYERGEKAWSRLQRALRLDTACAFADGRSAKAEAAVEVILENPDDKVVLWAENLEHLSIVERLLDAHGIEWLRIDGSTDRNERRDAVQAFREGSARVMLGTKVLERGVDGLQHATLLISLGSTFNPAREAQREGRLRRIGSPHSEVCHLTFLSETPHERRKFSTVGRRRRDAHAVLAC